MHSHSKRFLQALVALGSSVLTLASFTAQAAYVATFLEVGANVVETGNGSLTVTGLRSAGTAFGGAMLYGAGGYILEEIGPKSVPVDLYSAIFNGPNFFTAVVPLPTAGNGSLVGFFASFPDVGTLLVPTGYLSRADLATSTNTFANASFASLGLTPGTYRYGYGASETSAVVDTFTLQVGPAATVAEPGTVALAGLGLLAAISGAKRRREHRAMRNLEQ